MAATRLLSRVARRVDKIHMLHMPLERVRELARTARFLREADRHARFRKLQQCETVTDFYEFAAAMFDLHQIRSEIVRFLERARIERPHNICEIGTAEGGTNFLLSQALPTVSFMLGIDLFVKNKARLRYFSRPGQGVRYLDGPSSDPRTLAMVRRELGGLKLDLLLIDGDHRYEGVRSDFLAYRHFVRDGGLIAFHDIVSDHRALHGRQTGPWAGDVPRFWQKLRPLYPTEEIVESYDQEGSGIGVVLYSETVSLPTDL